MRKHLKVSSPAEELKAILIPTDKLSVNAAGDLMIEDCQASSLLDKYGSPLYVLSETTLRNNYRRIHHAFSSVWPKPVTILYAIKANNNLAIRAILHQEGAGGECFGEGELYATFMGGADPHKVVLNGSNKSFSLIKRAVLLGVTVNIDAEDEINILAELAAELQRTIHVKLRMKVLTQAYNSITTDYFGGDRLAEYVRRVKWGFSAEAAEPLIQYLQGIEGIELRGYHYHIGRASRDPEFYRLWAKTLAEMVVELERRTGFSPRVLNIGGGWPREREPESRSFELNSVKIEDYAGITCSTLLEVLDRAGLQIPELWLEPGRYIVGNAVVFLATVGEVKRDLGMTWVNLDASTNNLMRIDTSGSTYFVFPAKEMDREFTEKVTIVGETCVDSIFAVDRLMPMLKRGEPVAILDAGMYAETSSTQLNGIPRPATVLVNNGQVDIIKERERIIDVFCKHRIPERILAQK